jgi:23S rRNA (adenine2030-N6)-methyltransferase
VANRHFGKLGDVWKHLPLCEVLTVERPSRYAETHAGSAADAPLDDPERRYGVHRFSSVAHRDAVLAGSRYAAHLELGVGRR